MDISKIKSMLPNEPRKGMLAWAIEQAAEDLGGEITLFHRESADALNEYEWLFENCSASSKPKWSAFCECTNCHENYFTAWVSNKTGSQKSYGIGVTVGEDGQVYHGWTSVEDPDSLILMDGDRMVCPFCGVETRLVHSSRLKAGRTYSAMIGSVETVGEYGVLMYWLVRRNIDGYGMWDIEVRPREAVVIGENGGLWRFSKSFYSQFGEMPADYWEHRTFRDPEQIPYYTWGSGYNTRRNTVGCFWWKETADLAGTTGEKTGVVDYIKQGGTFPAIYLRLWKEHRNVENLIKAGWWKFIHEEINATVDSALCYRSHALSAKLEYVMWNERKPHNSLGMSKADFKYLANSKWSNKVTKCWIEYCKQVEKGISARQFNEYTNHWGSENVSRLVYMQHMLDFDLPKTINYLGKQKDIPMRDVVQFFTDYRRMLANNQPAAELTEVELWPPNLRAAHDRLSQIIKINADKMELEKFTAIKEKYRPLEWTDGEFCIVVPDSNLALVQEGKVLNHCVGGYGKSHLNGNPIFFVRRYRRPERSYFTLNENLRERTPQRLQLHGYKNELLGGKRLQIPKKVEAFVERWEREILAPWFEAQMNPIQNKKEKKSA